MYQPVKLTWAKHAWVSKNAIVFSFRHCCAALLLGCLWVGVLSGGLMAQGSHTVDLKTFVHSVSVSGGTLNANESGTVSLYLGSSSAQVAHALGIQLVLTVHNDAVLPSDPLSVNVGGSWLLSDVTVTQSLDVEASTRVMTLTLQRDAEAGSESGYGLLLSFPLVAAQNGVTASTMVSNVGGVVIVENIDMRMAAVVEPAPATEGVSFYPNPCRDRLRVHINGEGPAEVRLRGMDGQVFVAAVRMEGGMAVADIGGVRPGIYWAEVWREGNRIGGGTELVVAHE